MNGPTPVAFGVAALFRAMPGPDLDSTARDTWLEAKAAFFDRIADAAATPDLEAEARACAAATRAHRDHPTKTTPSTSSTSGTSTRSRRWSATNPFGGTR